MFFKLIHKYPNQYYASVGITLFIIGAVIEKVWQ